MAAVGAFLRVLGLSLLLFPVAMSLHEVLHLAVYSAQGVSASLLVTHWHLGLMPGLAIWGLHAAPAGPVSLRTYTINNGLGPGLAAAVFFVVWLAVDRRSLAVRGALLANVLALVFFAVIEVAYPVVPSLTGASTDVLLLPELNYGVVLLLMLLVALASAARPSPRPPGALGRRLRARDPEPHIS